VKFIFEESRTLHSNQLVIEEKMTQKQQSLEKSQFKSKKTFPPKWTGKSLAKGVKRFLFTVPPFFTATVENKPPPQAGSRCPAFDNKRLLFRSPLDLSYFYHFQKGTQEGCPGNRINRFSAFPVLCVTLIAIVLRHRFNSY
jgi:hypothetical protein